MSITVGRYLFRAERLVDQGTGVRERDGWLCVPVSR
jgi:hypothetical protein